MLRPALLAALLLAAACRSGAPEQGEKPTPPAEPPPAPKPAEPGPTPGKPITFSSEDGAALAGEVYVAAPGAPAVVLVHRLLGDRSEFQPLVERLRKSERRASILSFDLRGHGASKEPETKPAKAPSKAELARDVEAAIAQVSNNARGIVLVGSSFGATLATLVAFEQPKVTGLGLVSPGSGIYGVDLLRPYAEVRNLPTLVAGAEQDTIAKQPLEVIGGMAQRGTVKRYSGSRHGAQFLGEEQPELWQDLEQWIASIWEEKPVPRVSLKYAPGKEPKAGKAGR
jgi:pimeloyl-ACP methyl ester carboxylesterase